MLAAEQMIKRLQKAGYEDYFIEEIMLAMAPKWSLHDVHEYPPRAEKYGLPECAKILTALTELEPTPDGSGMESKASARFAELSALEVNPNGGVE